jgi:hypothetical protein
MRFFLLMCRVRYLIVLLLVWSCPVMATPVFSAAAGGDARWFDWREYQDGEQLLSETGPQLFGVARLGITSGHWRASVESQLGGGAAQYDGQLQTGEAYAADATEQAIDTDWRLAWGDGKMELSVGVLQRDWRRFIEGASGVSSAEERYRWRLLVWGVGAQVAETQGWTWSLSARIGTPFDSTEKVYLGGGYDDVALEPGDGLYWRVAVPLKSRSLPRLSLEPYFQQQTLKQSDVVPLTQNGVSTGIGLFQPESVRRELGLTLLWQLMP